MKAWEIWTYAFPGAGEHPAVIISQMFDLYAMRQMPVTEVARFLGTNVARVYLAKHRVQALLRQEIAELEREGR